MIESSNPVRGSRMAVDVLIPFEKVNGCSLTFRDLVDPRKLRDLEVIPRKRWNYCHFETKVSFNVQQIYEVYSH